MTLARSLMTLEMTFMTFEIVEKWYKGRNYQGTENCIKICYNDTGALLHLPRGKAPKTPTCSQKESKKHC